MQRSPFCYIACGGTGGHLTPGIALAQALKRRGYQVCLVVSQKSIDQRLLAAYPEFSFVAIAGRGFAGKNIFKAFKALLSQLKGLLTALKLIKRHRPCQVIGFGGFSTAALAVAAFILRQPVFLHESNRVVGKTIRYLAHFSKKIFLPEGVSIKGIPANKLEALGFPLRDGFDRLEKADARDYLQLPKEGKLLLVFGGSQGASGLTQWVRSHIELFAANKIHVVCLTGLSEGEVVVRNAPLSQLPCYCHFMPFCDTMPQLLSASDLTVSRSGAGSIAEIMRVRLPAVFVPYPHAADNHQEANAAYVAQFGAAVVVNQDHLEALWPKVLELLRDESQLAKMKAAWEGLDKENSQEKLADYLNKA